MEIKNSVCVHLTEEDVMKIVAEHLKENHNLSLTSLKADFRTRTEGFGMCERPVSVFAGFLAECEQHD